MSLDGHRNIDSTGDAAHGEVAGYPEMGWIGACVDGLADEVDGGIEVRVKVVGRSQMVVPLSDTGLNAADIHEPFDVAAGKVRWVIANQPSEVLKCSRDRVDRPSDLEVDRQVDDKAYLAVAWEYLDFLGTGQNGLGPTGLHTDDQETENRPA